MSPYNSAIFFHFFIGFKVYFLFLIWLQISISAHDHDSYSTTYRPATTTKPYSTTHWPYTSTNYYTTTKRPYPSTTHRPYTSTNYYTTTKSPYPSTTHRPYTSTNYPTTASPGGECPDGWIESLEGCFLFHHSANVMTWREAQEECERLGGYLAEIGSEEE